MLEMNFIDTRSSIFLNVENILLIDSNACFRYVLVERGYLFLGSEGSKDDSFSASSATTRRSTEKWRLKYFLETEKKFSFSISILSVFLSATTRLENIW